MNIVKESKNRVHVVRILPEGWEEDQEIVLGYDSQEDSVIHLKHLLRLGLLGTLNVTSESINVEHIGEILLSSTNFTQKHPPVKHMGINIYFPKIS